MLSRILKIFPWVVSFVLAGVLLMECRSGSRELVSEPFTKFKTVTPEPVKIIDSVKTERKVEAFKALPKEESRSLFRSHNPARIQRKLFG